LQEIEAAVENLPLPEQEELLTFLAERVRRPMPAGREDTFDAVIGAFAGPEEATGRRAEDILYGKSH
jgi:hypothetical protein